MAKVAFFFSFLFSNQRFRSESGFFILGVVENGTNRVKDMNYRRNFRLSNPVEKVVEKEGDGFRKSREST